MKNVLAGVTCTENFYGSSDPIELLERFGSPLYVYNEDLLRKRCRQMKNLISYPNFSVSYSAKANSNVHLLEIIRAEGLDVDAMSPGEIYVELAAGFTPQQIMFISNNVSSEEMSFALEKNVIISVDSLSQLQMLGKLNRGGQVAIRINPGVGAGHHAKVITGGKGTKFGIDTFLVPEIKALLTQYQLQLVGLNHHIGSLFLDATAYIAGAKTLLAVAAQFPSLDFIDFGGGFGVPYNKLGQQARLDLEDLGQQLMALIVPWVKNYGKEITFKIEPGRYVVAECGVLLGTVHAVKQSYGQKFIGTDIGFNVLSRSVLYDAQHDVEIYRRDMLSTEKEEAVTIVGNICETGDVILRHKVLPQIIEGDVLGILDAGAYGYAMSSNYNNRLRPAEVLIESSGNVRLIRRADILEDLMRNY